MLDVVVGVLDGDGPLGGGVAGAGAIPWIPLLLWQLLVLLLEWW